VFVFNPIREPYSKTAPRGYAKEKYYNKDGKVIGDVWQMPILGQNDKTERVDYDTQKPKKLLNQIINLSSNKNDLVADFYCGSGTSMIVAKELGRQYIGCDINQRAVDITNKRLDDYNPLF
ncbi:MAG: DNA methyltransferase, partial [Alphaproteobacteria bacterium]